jgi:mRNA interferase RelE/StbE
MKVEYRAAFLKDVERLPVFVRQAILETLTEMEATQKLTDLVGVKKLKGYGNGDVYRIRVGQYRLVWHWDKDLQVITMLKTADRKDIYK